MLAWETIDSAQVPDSSVMLRLMRRGEEFAIWVDGRPLMTSREHGSEDALAKLVCSRLGLASAEHSPGGRDLQRRPNAATCFAAGTEKKLRRANGPAVPSRFRIHDRRQPGAVDSATCTAPCLLVGGLGMGFTLAAALDSLPADAVVEVAELVPQVVEWNRGPLGHLAGFPLDDPRVIIHQADVAAVLRSQHPAATAMPPHIPAQADPPLARYDAILLDVDNGPRSLSTPANSWLYSPDGVRAAATTLRPGGFLAVWSAGPDASFTNRLRKSGLDVDELLVRSRGPKGGCHHTVWLARRTT